MKISILHKELSFEFKFPAYSLGTWLMGGDKVKNSHNNDNKNIETIRMNIDTGVVSIFTAQNYAEGYTEELVAKGIGSYQRKKIILSTAVKRKNGNYDVFIKSFFESLERLNTKYIDVLFHHARDIDTPIKDTIKAMNTLVDDGYVHHIALSNYSKESLKEAMSFSKYPIVINQVHYSLIYREPESSGLLEFCQDNDVFLQAYRPLDAGNLKSFDEKHVCKIAKKYNLSNQQVALSWLSSQKNVIVVCTTSNQNHLLKNIEAINTKLSCEDVELLRENFSHKTNVSNICKLE